MQAANNRPSCSGMSVPRRPHFYRCIMDVFAAAKRQYRLQLRPDEVLAEADGRMRRPRIEEVNAALAQLTAWGNLESHPDTARVSSLSDFYRARFLYRLSQGGEAVEVGAGAVRADPAAPRRTANGGARGHREPAAGACRRWPSEAEARRRQDPRDAARSGARFRGPGRERAGLHGRRRAQHRAAAGRSERGGELQAPADRLSGAVHGRSGAPLRHHRPPHPRPGAAHRRHAAAGRGARSARCRARRCAGPGRRADRGTGKPGANAGRACAAGSSAPATSRRKPSCCGRGHGRPSRNCWARSPRSTSGAAAAATARRISACSPAGSPPAPTTARRTGWRAPPSRSIRRGISR